MSDRSIVLLVRGLALVAAVMAVLGSVMSIGATDVQYWQLEEGGFIATVSLFFAVLVWLVIPQQPRNAVVWSLTASCFCGGFYSLGWASALVIVDDPTVTLAEPIQRVVAAELPFSAALVLMLAAPGAILAFYFWLTFGLLLFPDGRLPSPRWRWVGILAAFGMLSVVVGFVVTLRPGSTVVAENALLVWVGFLVSTLAIVLSFAALVVRFRASRGAVRDQFKWVVWGASIFVPTLVFASMVDGTRFQDAATVPLEVAAVISLGSYGIAVGKYRLFDIDVVISRTVVVAGLAAFITVVYAAIVVTVGWMLGDATGAALPLSIAATVIVAIAFEPLRQRMRRWAHRLVYGTRATPYEVLSRFSEQMRHAVVTEDMIPQIAQLLTEGTGANQAVVWMKGGKEYEAAAIWPIDDGLPDTRIGADGELLVPSADHVAAVEHHGELLGAVSVSLPRGEAMTATAERLVDDVASQAGLVLRNARLIQQLRASRQRLVAAQDEERRRLERDLHDGAQQQLVALKMKLGLVQRLDTDQRDEMLESLLEDTDDAIQSLRDLAHGIYPPLLELEGLEAALRARVVKAPIGVSITADGLERYPPEVETAVYFCVLESVQNALKYSEADAVSVSLHHHNGRLSFEVSDDGRGFDSASTDGGRGFVNMADRLDVLGGALEVSSAPGRGTTIRGVLNGVATSSPAGIDDASAAPPGGPVLVPPSAG